MDELPKTFIHNVPQLSRVVFVTDSPPQLYSAPGVEKQFHSEMNNLSTGALCEEAWRGAEQLHFVKDFPSLR